MREPARRDPPEPPETKPAPAVELSPVLLAEVPPRYPRMAQALRREATVAVRVMVDARGEVVAAEAVGPAAGFGFEEAALEAALRTRFRPGTRDGVAQRMETVLRYRFVLE